MRKNRTMQGRDSSESPHDIRERMVREGNVRGLLELIERTPKGLLDLRVLYGQVRRAIDVASRGDPAVSPGARSARTKAARGEVTSHFILRGAAPADARRQFHQGPGLACP